MFHENFWYNLHYSRVFRDSHLKIRSEWVRKWRNEWRKWRNLTPSIHSLTVTFLVGSKCFFTIKSLWRYFNSLNNPTLTFLIMHLYYQKENFKQSIVCDRLILCRDKLEIRQVYITRMLLPGGGMGWDGVGCVGESSSVRLHHKNHRRYGAKITLFENFTETPSRATHYSTLTYVMADP